MNTVQQPMYEWQDLPWKKFERSVFKLQKRIYQASIEDDRKTVHKLQRLLINSWHARCLAVRRVTQDNRGKNTAGIDGVKRLSPKQRLYLAQTLKLRQKARPVRRVWIPIMSVAKSDTCNFSIMFARCFSTVCSLIVRIKATSLLVCPQL